MEQRAVRRPAHQQRHRQPDPQGPDHSLRHDEQRLPAAVEKAHKAEQEAGKQAVNGVGLEILPGGGDHRRVVREKYPPAHLRERMPPSP